MGTGFFSVMEKRSISLVIILIKGVKRNGVIKLKKAVLDLMLKRRTTFMLSALGVSKRNLQIWLPVYYKSSVFMFML